MSAGGYEFDVFVSYRHSDGMKRWVSDVCRCLTHWLAEELGGRRPTVFFDDVSIETGERWPEKLQHSVLTSRCLLSIWSPGYFRSPWCLSEWKSFLERERHLNIQTGSLIIPVVYHDGEWFPPETNGVQSFDLRRYTYVTPTFWNTERGVELEEKLKILASHVAHAVDRAPPFRTDWPVILETDASPAPSVPLPRL